MSSISFDTHKFIKELRESGIPEPQAEAFVRAQQEILSQAFDSTLATNRDVEKLDTKEKRGQTRYRIPGKAWQTSYQTSKKGWAWLFKTLQAATLRPQPPLFCSGFMLRLAHEFNHFRHPQIRSQTSGGRFQRETG